MESIWETCPECGSKKYNEGENYQRECIDCKQEYFSDINYSDVIGFNLRVAKEQIQQMKF